jgi:phage-related protein
MLARRLVFYTDADDRSPVLEFLRGLNTEQRRKVGRSIRLLEELGTALTEPHAKYLQDGLWELRTQAGGDAFRCLYFTWTGRRFVILHAFQKKTEKTPKREIETALRRRADWLTRHKEEGWTSEST